MSMAIIIAIRHPNEASVSFILLFLCMFCFSGAHAADTLRHINWLGSGLTHNHAYEGGLSRKTLTILTNNETLVSEKGVFELGFFGGRNSSYLGIWFKYDEHKKVVWVANRKNPFLNSSCTLQIDGDGNLMLSNCVETVTVINNGRPATTWNTSLTLLDSGNLVLSDQRGNLIWQSVDFPTDTFLPGMKIGLNNLKDRSPSIRNLISWSSPDNPAPGDFTLEVANSSSKSLRISQGNDFAMDIGSWDGNSFRFFFHNYTNSYNFSYVSNEKETYFTFHTKYGFSPSWLVIASSGQLVEYHITDGTVLSLNHFLCNQTAGDSGNASCLNMKPSKCKGDKFSKINGTMPLSLYESGLVHVEMENCEIICRNNCSCSAYSFYIENDTICQLYYGDKTHFLNVMEKEGSTTFYIRGDLRFRDERQRRVTKIILCSLLPASVLFTCYLACSIRWKILKRKQDDELLRNGFTRLLKLELHNKQKKHQVTFFDISAIKTATNSFASANKLGEGGFGPVYKGRLQDGQEIAVKRLSKASKQGLDEFKNEVTLISELQHRNLVKLLGCCIEGGEQMLIYEYMPNASLDYVLFDSTKRKKLDWRTRVNIIHGIAHGILYLHEFSGLKIVHRDLKPSNILLDNEMNPKISDFGMAKMILGNETPRTTERVVGTLGYMAPEYAMDGQFSEKSDVFSFGIILLELISGRKNVALCDPNQSHNLVIKAWKLWKEGKSMEFMDSALSPCSKSEVVRLIKLGLLCVQGSTSDRPTMSEFFSGLNTDVEALPSPKEPSFATARRFLCGQTDQITFTDLDPR